MNFSQPIFLSIWIMGEILDLIFFLGSVHKVGVNLLIIGDTGGLKEVSTPITRNRTLGRNRHQYKGWSLWVGIIG